MNKKSLFLIISILVIPVLAFFCLTFNKSDSSVAVAKGKPQVIKFSSTMCLECKEVEKIFKELLPVYQDKFVYTEVIVDSRDGMKNELIKEHNVKLVPTVIMFNSDGTLHKRIESAIPKEEMEGYIKELN